MVCLFLMAIVGAGSAASAQHAGAASSVLLPRSLDLLQRFPIAHVAVDDATLGEIPIDSNERFAGGWYQASQTADGQSFRWMGPRAGVVDLAMVDPEALTLRLGMTIPRGEHVPPIRVTFYWNGNYLGIAELRGAAQTIETQVAAELTRPGMNRLEIYPSFWINAGRLSGGEWSSRNISVNLFRLQLIRAADATPRAKTSLPTGSKGGSVHQPGNTVVAYYTRLGDASRLSVEGEWPADAIGTSSEAIVVVTDAEGDTRELARFASPQADDAAPRRQVIDLSEYADRFVEISTIVRQTGDGDVRPRAFQWNHLRLEGDASPKAAPNAASTSFSGRPNVVLLVFDTLRADYTEPYGARNVSTPNFTQLAKRGMTFMNAYSPTSWTRSSIATLMTSLYEPRHGTASIEDKLSTDVPYLPELLRTAGYRTVGVSMNGHITEQWGFDRGFDAFHGIGALREQLLSAHPTPEEYVDAVWEQYVAPESENADRPFFLYFHEIDPHGPYAPRPPFDTMYPTAYRGHPEVEADNVNLVRLRLTELAPQDIAYIESRYRGEVSFVDAVLGALLARLEQAGLSENTVVIATSDHGEEFGEHGGIGHMVTLYDEMLRVPLVWSWPGHIANDAREESEIGLIDATPTLLGLLGVTIPATMEGRDLSQRLRNPTDTGKTFPLLAHKGDNPDKPVRAIRWGGWKLYERNYGAQSEYELYDLANDPGEIMNQWTGEREIGGALKQLLDWYEQMTSGQAARTEKVEMQTIDPEAIEQLRNLGYLQ